MQGAERCAVSDKNSRVLLGKNCECRSRCSARWDYAKGRNISRETPFSRARNHNGHSVWPIPPLVRFNMASIDTPPPPPGHDFCLRVFLLWSREEGNGDRFHIRSARPRDETYLSGYVARGVSPSPFEGPGIVLSKGTWLHAAVRMLGDYTSFPCMVVGDKRETIPGQVVATT